MTLSLHISIYKNTFKAYQLKKSQISKIIYYPSKTLHLSVIQKSSEFLSFIVKIKAQKKNTWEMLFERSILNSAI